MFVNALAKVSISKNSLFQHSPHLNKVINNALFVNNLLFWFAVFGDVSDFLGSKIDFFFYSKIDASQRRLKILLIFLVKIEWRRFDIFSTG